MQHKGRGGQWWWLRGWSGLARAERAERSRQTGGRGARRLGRGRGARAVLLRIDPAQVQGVPANRVAVLARYGLTAKAPALRQSEPRRTATLLAAVRQLEADAVDDALDCSTCSWPPG